MIGEWVGVRALPVKAFLWKMERTTESELPKGRNLRNSAPEEEDVVLVAVQKALEAVLCACPL